MTNVRRIYVEKRKEYATEAHEIQTNLVEQLGLTIHSLRIVHRYDVQGISEEILQQGINTILAEPMVDHVYDETFPMSEKESVFAIEFLPGQYDQRADSCEQCFQILTGTSSTKVRCAKLIVVDIDKNEDVLNQIKHYLINPVDQRIASLEKPEHLNDETPDIKSVPTLTGFNDLDETGLNQFLKDNGMAMNLDDLKVTQGYFKNEEHRDPTETEIKVLDTYWSDHCRHTTVITDIDIQNGAFKEILEKDIESYKTSRHAVYGVNTTRPLTLMDLATISMKELRKKGYLDDMEVSEEINACSIEITVHTNQGDEQWLLMFKNETHNHPTEIEPFGGASTCIGGAIRDPLSGRSYVYQAMRITGAGDITKPISETLEHKLPQSKISKTAAQGYSSYGNQIGLATTFVDEIYDDCYVAKRMEVGAVVGAAPKSHVKREQPQPGDIIVMIGGATGRDGIGGATGSSKEHNETSLEKCSSEVQKGNALIERKLQRLFRNPACTKLIKKANDFGAGGVSVAVGELADGLDINLDAVPVKYQGLDGTELAISESQERMAVCIEAKDFEKFKEEAYKENLEAIKVADVTDTNRLVMKWRGETIVDMSRAFLDTNGVRQHQVVDVCENEYDEHPFDAVKSDLNTVLQDANVASQIGLAEMFDASIGKSTVLMPFGGKYQLTPEEGSVQKLPVHGMTNTCSVMTYGYDPKVSKYSPYLGASYSVVEALARITALGADYKKCRLSNQEYFEHLGTDAQKWGQPFEALLGLIDAQLAFETPSIGGKDSMSGTYKDIHVPPTVITFAVTTAKTDNIVSASFKNPGDYVYLVKHTPVKNHVPNYEQLKENFETVHKLMQEKKIVAASTIKFGGLGATVAKMAFGSKVGVAINTEEDVYGFNLGSMIVEATESIQDEHLELIGILNDDSKIVLNEETVEIEDAFKAWTKRYSEIYPMIVDEGKDTLETPLNDVEVPMSKVVVEKPKVIIPIFPGQNCEFDTTAKFERAGAEVKQVVFNNLTVENIQKSIDTLAEEISTAQILMIVGGFSSGDEPDGSGKFIANVLRNPKIAQAIDAMRANDGLILGICNGFQALIKSGLLPYGDIEKLDTENPTLFRNNINRHVSHIARTRITSNASPWLAGMKAGSVYSVAVSHGEGKFVASEEVLNKLIENGQVATQYVNENGVPTMDGKDNLNGSSMAIEGIFSEDGKIFGKMGHSERYEKGLFQNIAGNKDQDIFANGVRYFTHKQVK